MNTLCKYMLKILGEKFEQLVKNKHFLCTDKHTYIKIMNLATLIPSFIYLYIVTTLLIMLPLTHAFISHSLGNVNIDFE